MTKTLTQVAMVICIACGLTAFLMKSAHAQQHAIGTWGVTQINAIQTNQPV